MREWIAGWLPAFLGLARDAWDSLVLWVRGNLAELVAAAGGYLVADGARQVYGPAGPLVSGALLILGAVCLARSRAGR